MAVTVTLPLASVCLGVVEISIPLSRPSTVLSAIKPLPQAPASFSRGLPVGCSYLFSSPLSISKPLLQVFI